MSEQLHITGLVVHAMPSRLRGVADAIAAMPGAQVHATAENGKLVVTLEAGTAQEMMAMVNGIQHTRGVLSAGLVYECVDSLEAMNEEISDAHDAQGLH